MANRTCVTCKHEPDWNSKTKKAYICKVKLPSFASVPYGTELIWQKDGIYSCVTGPEGGMIKLINCEAWEAKDD